MKFFMNRMLLQQLIHYQVKFLNIFSTSRIQIIIVCENFPLQYLHPTNRSWFCWAHATVGENNVVTCNNQNDVRELGNSFIMSINYHSLIFPLRSSDWMIIISWSFRPVSIDVILHYVSGKCLSHEVFKLDVIYFPFEVLAGNALFSSRCFGEPCFVSHSFMSLHDIYRLHWFNIQYQAQYRQHTPSFHRTEMENISLSLSRRSFSSNAPFTSHKSVYDDVFGGPPKLGLPTLAPRFEDYSEIFGGFHTSQSSSIPVLHLPLIASEDTDLHFDVDYTEVFGGYGGFDVTASPEDLVGHSSGGYDSDSSGDPWYLCAFTIYCLPLRGMVSHIIVCYEAYCFIFCRM